MTEFLPGLLAQPGVEGLTGSVRLHATDGASQWWVNLSDKDRAVAVPTRGGGWSGMRAPRSVLNEKIPELRVELRPEPAPFVSPPSAHCSGPQTGRPGATCPPVARLQKTK